MCVNPETDQVAWKKQFSIPEGIKSDYAGPRAHMRIPGPALTQPVTVNGKVFIGTIYGDMVCLAADSGEELWKVNVGEPLDAEPVVAYGRIYLTTAYGSLYSLETGDQKDDGWLMWGANAEHTGIVASSK